MKERRLYLSFQLIYTTFDVSIPGMFLTIFQQNAVILRSTNNNCIRKFLIVFIFHSKTSDPWCFCRAWREIPRLPCLPRSGVLAVQLLEQQKTLDIQSISEMAELVEGSFVFTVLDENSNLYFVKGDNPLALYHYETCGLYVYASMEAILDRALTRLGILSIEHQQIDTTCGDILKIDSSGAMERGLFDTTNLMMARRISRTTTALFSLYRTA